MHFDVVVYYDTLEKKKEKEKNKNKKTQKKVVLSYVISCMHDACERAENGRVRNFIHSDVLIFFFFSVSLISYQKSCQCHILND